LEGSEDEERLSFNNVHGRTLQYIKEDAKDHKKERLITYQTECSRRKLLRVFWKTVFFSLDQVTGSTKKLKEQDYKYTGKNITSKIKYNTDKRYSQGIVFTTRTRLLNYLVRRGLPIKTAAYETQGVMNLNHDKV